VLGDDFASLELRDNEGLWSLCLIAYPNFANTAQVQVIGRRVAHMQTLTFSSLHPSHLPSLAQSMRWMRFTATHHLTTSQVTKESREARSGSP
jgi:hypothetical protein